MFLAAAAAAQTPVPASVDAAVPYVVKPGDTLSEIAQRYLVPERGWHDLARLFHVSNPRTLPRGRTLRIPRNWLRWTPEQARLANARGQVTLSQGGRAVAPDVGTVLGEGAVIATAGGSFATLVLSNGARVALPSQSRVRVAMLRKYVINGAIDYRFALDRGRADIKATPLTDPSGNFLINTPLSMTAVRGTDYTVTFDEAQNGSGTGVFEGRVQVSRPDGEAPQMVAERFGVVTDAAGKNTTVALLPEAEVQNPGRVQTDDLVVFDIAPVAGATAYQLTLASDAGYVERYFEQRSPTPHFEIPGVPNGNQFVRVSALAESGLEGMRQSYAFRRRLASIGAEVGKTEDGYAFKWFGNGEGKRHYRLQIFRDSTEGNPVVDEVGIEGTGVTVRDLPPGVYFWRVGLTQFDTEGEIGNWTRPEKLTIAPPEGG